MFEGRKVCLHWVWSCQKILHLSSQSHPSPSLVNKKKISWEICIERLQEKLFCHNSQIPNAQRNRTKMGKNKEHNQIDETRKWFLYCEFRRSIFL
jgi:hypothetical protein